MKIQKLLTNENILARIQEKGRILYYKPIKPRIGKIYHLILRANDQTHVYCKLTERLPTHSGHYYLELLSTATSLKIGDRFRFKARKTTYLFAGWCGIENLPMCTKIGSLNPIYFNPEREVIHAELNRGNSKNPTQN